MSDLIAAAATAPGISGIAVVRASGDGAGEMLKKLTGKKRLRDREMFYARVKGADGSSIDEVMACFMAAPRTYTREDTAEIYCHGGYLSARAVLKRIFEEGARPAGNGEFTRRAFENGRIDLSQAEAVMQLVASESESAEKCALRQLDGSVSSFVRNASEALQDVMARIEAATDFPEEIGEEEAALDVRPRMERVLREIERNTRPGSAKMIRDGASVVLSGRPNVGKSSIMNRLLGHDRAIVTPVAGTTRDVISEDLSVGGIKVALSDTAGLRDASDEAEGMGVEMARRAMDGADIVLCVVDASSGLTGEDERILAEAGDRAIPVVNKCDLVRKLPPIRGEVRVSCVTGEGFDELLSRMGEKIASGIYPDACLVAQRHIECARAAAEALRRGIASIEKGMALDAVTMDVKEALEKICEVTGENAQEDVIDRVFRDFCVGK